jgi:hypothetical protein
MLPWWSQPPIVTWTNRTPASLSRRASRQAGPWRFLQTLAKTTQLKALRRWLSRDSLPAYVSSFARVAVWCRRDSQGRSALLLLNASADPLATIKVHVCAAGRLEMTRSGQRTAAVPKAGRDCTYTVFDVPRAGGWEPVLLRVQ